MKDLLVDFLFFYYSVPANSLIAFWGVIGLCIGSFINVVTYRYPKMLDREWQAQARLYIEQQTEDVPSTREELQQEQEHLDAQMDERFDLHHPRSHCPSCQAAVVWWMNIPVLSWLLLRGKCHYCKTSIAIEYPLVELATALLTMAVIWLFPVFHITTYWLLIFIWVLLALARVDAKSGLLPDSMTLSLLWLGLLVNASLAIVPLQDAVMGAAIGYMFLRTLATFFFVLRGYSVLGGGDIKLCAALGAWLGWQALPLILFMAPVITMLIGLPYNKASNETYRFGPGLAYSTFLMLWLTYFRPEELAALLPFLSF